jgi:RNA 2',3'-cyclic 3'-phosphodiesterase
VAAEEPRAQARGPAPTRRLFFALFPDEAMRQALAEAARNAVRTSGGRPVRTENLHLTLAFLGSVAERRVPELEEIGRQAAASRAGREPSLDIAFDHLEYWRTAQLLCALPAAPPAALVALARRLQALLGGRGFAPDLKPFRPHVTVVRKVLRPGRIASLHPVLWRFTELALAESRTRPEGPLYTVVAPFPLRRDQILPNSSIGV